MSKEAVEKEIDEAAKEWKDHYYRPVFVNGYHDAYIIGAREFVRRTEERVAEELVNFIDSHCGENIAYALKLNCKKRGYLK